MMKSIKIYVNISDVKRYYAGYQVRIRTNIPETSLQSYVEMKVHPYSFIIVQRASADLVWIQKCSKWKKLRMRLRKRKYVDV